MNRKTEMIAPYLLRVQPEEPIHHSLEKNESNAKDIDAA